MTPDITINDGKNRNVYHIPGNIKVYHEEEPGSCGKTQFLTITGPGVAAEIRGNGTQVVESITDDDSGSVIFHGKQEGTLKVLGIIRPETAK